MFSNSKIVNKKNIIFFYIFISFLFTFYILGINNINPKTENWLFTGDRASDLLAWKYFFNDSWRFPLGSNKNFGLDISNSIAYSGSPPLYAFIFKFIKIFLPNNFNYFSILIFLSLFLQIYLGYLIIYKLTKNQIFSIISSFLFILLPIFLFKIKFHFSLISHWIILSYFYVYLLNINYRSKKIKFLIILLLSCLIHFYFTIMILLMIFISRIILLYSNKNYLSFFKDSIYFTFPLLLLMYVVGYFMLPPLNTLGGGYGYYNLNLISFFNPHLEGLSWSYFIPIIYNDNAEGFAYLGLGVILVLIHLLFYITFKYKNINFKKKKELIFIFLILLILAISNNIEFGDKVLLRLELNKYIYAILSVIRASIRIIWPCIYIILIFGVFSIYKNFNRKTSLILIIFISLIQIIDISNGLKSFEFGKSFVVKKNDFSDERLKIVKEKFQIISATNIYNENNHFHKLAPLISNLMIKTEIVLLARTDRKKQSELTYKNNSNFLNMKNETDKFYYIVTLGHLNHLKYIYKFQDVGFLNFNNSWFLVPKGKELMNKNEKNFIQNLNLNTIQVNKNNDLNNYDNYLNDKLIGLGWFYNKIDNQLYSDGNKSFLILNHDQNSYNKIIELNFKNVFFENNINNKVEIFVNNVKIDTMFFKKEISKKNISIDLSKFKTDEIIIELKFFNPLSLYDLKKGIDQKKRSVVLSSYKIINN